MTDRVAIERWEKLWGRADLEAIEGYTQASLFIADFFQQDMKNKLVLEVGAGSGKDCIALNKLGATCITLDYSRNALMWAKYFSQRDNYSIGRVLANGFFLPFKSESFDIVFSVGVIEHFKDPIPFIREQLRVVRQGSFLLIDVPQKYNMYTVVKKIRMVLRNFPFGWEGEFSASRLGKTLKSLDLKIVKYYGRSSFLSSRLPQRIRYKWERFHLKIDKSAFGPYVCLNLGVICQKMVSFQEPKENNKGRDSNG